jgi:hypothetical protein
VTVRRRPGGEGFSPVPKGAQVNEINLRKRAEIAAAPLKDRRRIELERQAELRGERTELIGNLIPRDRASEARG